MNGHIYRKMVEDFNDMTLSERKEKIEEMKVANPLKNLDTTGMEYLKLDL
jgi:hypothetical protein